MADVPQLPPQDDLDNFKDGLGEARETANEISRAFEDIANSTQDQAKDLMSVQERLGKISGLDEKRALKAIQITRDSKEAVKQAKLYQASSQAIIKGLEAQGKHLQANLQKIKDSVHQNGILGAGAEGAGKIAKGAEDIEANTYAALGPWGVLIKLIVDVIDGVRKTRSELQAAAADTGDFTNAWGTANRETININKNVGELMYKYGKTKEEVVALSVALKSTGFRDFGASVVSASGDINNFAKSAMNFANATGQDVGTVVGQYKALRTTFTGLKAPLSDISDAYLTMYRQGAKLANEGLATTKEWIGEIMGLGDAFSAVGMSMKSIEVVAASTKRAMRDMGFAIKDSAQITQKLLGAVNATSEGWKVLIGQTMGIGGGGGFSQTLFGMQQRGPGMKMPGSDKFDATTFLKQVGGAISKITSGVGDAANRQYLTEKIAGGMGLDERSTQVLQQLQAGKISAEEAAVSMEEIDRAAKKQNLDSHSMFDIIKTILVGMIAKPIVMIYDFLTRWLPGVKADPGMASVKKNMDKISSGANGLELITGGLVMGHAKEQMIGGKLMPVASTRPLNRDGSGGSSNNQFAFNVTIDESNIRKQFRDMENKTVTLLKKQQAANFSA